MSIALLLFIFLFSVTVSGCEPLRKKFVREKKRDKVVREEPILEPIEYPLRPYDVYSDYAHRYSMFYVWKKEFISAIDDQENSKRLLYFFDQMITKLDEMAELLTEEKNGEFIEVMNELYPIRDQLNNTAYVHYLSRIKREVNVITRLIRSQYNPTMMQQHIK
jgi:hypothetical protein